MAGVRWDLANARPAFFTLRCNDGCALVHLWLSTLRQGLRRGRFRADAQARFLGRVLRAPG